MQRLVMVESKRLVVDMERRRESEREREREVL